MIFHIYSIILSLGTFAALISCDAEKDALKAKTVEEFGRMQTKNSDIPERNPDNIRIVTYNVAKLEFASAEQLFTGMKQTGADIVVMQEVTKEQYENALIPLFQKLLPYTASCMTSRASERRGIKFTEKLGNVLFSKFPIVRQDSIKLTEFKGVLSKCAVDSVIRVNNMALIRVLGIHFSFGKDSLKKKIRNHQLMTMLKQAQVEPYQTIIAGDFNMPLTEISKYTSSFDLEESFSKSKSSPPEKTQWRGKWIDFLFSTSKLSVARSDTWYFGMSDHLPVSADFSLPFALRRSKSDIGHIIGNYRKTTPFSN